MNDEIFNIKLSLYKDFYTVCKTGSYSQAAKALGTTQPAISYNIKKLEDELNIKLFRRKSNGIELTKEAEMLIPYIEDAFASVIVGEQKVKSLLDYNEGIISIGIPSHIGAFLLVDLIKEFNEKYPNIRFKVISKPTRELFRLLHNNSIDIIIDSSPIENDYDFYVKKIGVISGEFACHYSRKELLDREISLKELLKYPIIIPSSTSSTTKELIKVFNKNNIDFVPMFEVSTSDMIANMIDKNIGIGFLLENTIDLYHNLRKINVVANFPKFEIYEIHKENNISVISKKFITYINESLK